MEIFVEKDGHELGPFTLAQLRQSLASADIAGDQIARIDGIEETSTVSRILARDGFSPRPPMGAPTAPQQGRSHPQISPSPPPPRGPGSGRVSREASNKLRPPNAAPPSLEGGASAKFRRSRRARVVHLPKPNTWELMRIAGSATPLLLALVLLVPWISGAFLPEVVRLNGYRTFAELSDLDPYLRIFVGTLALGSLGIGWFSLKGALEGGSEMPAATFISATAAAGSLLVLALALPAESRTIHHLGGACAAAGTLLLGTAFGGIPGKDNTPASNLILWIVCGCLAVSALIFFLVASSMKG